MAVFFVTLVFVHIQKFKLPALLRVASECRL